MRKKTMIKVLSLGLVLGLSSQVSFATELEAIESNREANVTFTPGEGGGEGPGEIPTDPEIDPGPELPIEGNLGFSFLINTMDFGEVEISEREINIPMIAEGRDENNPGNPTASFMQVVDTRGVAEGWDVNARLSDFVSESNSESTIRGVRILLNNTSRREGSDLVGNNIDQIVLNPNETQNLTTAEQLTGSMINKLSLIWGDSQVDSNGILGEERNESIILNIPSNAGVLADDYTATITWSIENIVGEEE